ncbi:MAG TPA: M48 family metalloprotease, partial [Thermoanaerobaculia bacterium]|nr:M48 family metalloprotease [Thermoanaerobaculia bacterium]
VVAALLLPAAGAAQKISNPELFAKSIAAAQEAVDEYGTWDDVATLRHVADIGYRVAAASGYKDFPLSFFLVEMREPNAFALPGGQVFLTRGMVELGLDDDQLAALLGHEMAHVTLGHGMKMQRRATLLNVLAQAALVGVILADRGSSPTPGVPTWGPGPEQSSYGSGGARIQGAAAASLILAELLLRSYSREFEDQADEEGQRMATAAGYAPNGGARLFDLMKSRLPQSHEYGYWRTHPFFDERVTAAAARGKLLTRGTPRPDAPYRGETQAALLGFEPKEVEGQEAQHEAQKLLLASAALTAWPQGTTAEKLRLDTLHRERDEELARPELSRDYGKLIAAYTKQLDEVKALTPESPFVAKLTEESKALRGDADALYAKAQETIAAGVYQTEFLQAFLSNYPQAPEAPRVAFELAGAYSRTNRQADAVDKYLAAWRGDPKSPLGERSLAGLRTLASVVTDLVALQQLADQDDAELARAAGARLDQLASSYRVLADGAEYLRKFPQGSRADKVAGHLDQLAEQLYGEVVLYQGVGDTLKALDRIQQILTHAPLSPAAGRLRERAVLAT